MIANLWAYIDLFVEKINTLSIGFQIYAGKPLDEISGINGYCFIVDNTVKVADDTTWPHLKEALMEFVIIAPTKATPDVVLYEHLDHLVNQIVLEEWNAWALTGGFKIGSIREGNQSGVMHDVKERPHIIAQFYVTYQSRYNTAPRI